MNPLGHKLNPLGHKRQKGLPPRCQNEDSPLSVAGGFFEDTEGEEANSPYYDTKSKQLYQSNPKPKSTYTKKKVYSWTDSLESYQNNAKRERNALRWNNRIPKIEIRLNFKSNEFSFEEIIEHKTKICRTLQRSTKKRKGIQAVANFELTTRHGKPNNRVHCHFLTDDTRSPDELKEFFILACERCGLVEGEDFRIKTRPLWNGKKYFDYFTKYGKKHRDKVVLFKKIKKTKKSEPTEKGANHRR